MVYSKSNQDIDLAAWFSVVTGNTVRSCKWWTDNYWQETGKYRAFEFGHTALNNDNKFTVICLNVTALGYPTGFDQVSNVMKIRGIEHEMGHSIHLDHRSSGIMNMNWLDEIDSHDVSAVLGIYSSPQ